VTSAVANRGITWPLAGLSLAMLLPSLGTSIANPALPTFAADFGASFQGIQWIVLAYLLAMTTLVVSAGRLGDIFGRRRLLLGGVAVFAAASAIAAFATGLWLLIAARALQGVGAAVMMSLATALVGDLVPREKTGRAMGMLGTTSAVGTALGPSLGGFLVAGFGWPSIFIFLAAMATATFFILQVGTPARSPVPRATVEQFDTLGVVLLGLTLAAYALSMTVGHGAFGPLSTGLLLAAGAGVAVFAAVQTKVASPTIQLLWLRDKQLRSGLIATALVSTIMMSTLAVGPFFLSEALGLKPGAIGLAMSVGPVLAAVTGLPAGRMVDRFRARPIILIGLVGIVAGCLLLALFSTTIGVVGYVIAIGTSATGYAAFQAANNTAILRDIDPRRRGVIAGLLNLARNLGLITGASAMGALFTFGAGARGVGRPPAVESGTALTFAVAAGLGVVAFGLAFLSNRQRGDSLRDIRPAIGEEGNLI
jgi:MFS family permease